MKNLNIYIYSIFNKYIHVTWVKTQIYRGMFLGRLRESYYIIKLCVLVSTIKIG